MGSDNLKGMLTAILLNLAALNFHAVEARAAEALWLVAGDGRRIGQVSRGRELGHGALGTVYEITLTLPSGETQSVALKEWDPTRASREAVGRFMASHRSAQSLLDLHATPFIHFERGGLFLESAAGKRKSVILSEIMDGSVSDLRSELRLSGVTEQADLAARTRLLHQVMVESSSGVQQMGQGRLIHGDVKVENILYRRLPDGGITVALSDLDQVVSQGARARNFSPAFLAPEYLINPDRGSQTTRDIYSLAASLYEVVMGEVPWLGFVREDQKMAELYRRVALKRIEADPQVYRAYLQARAARPEAPFDAIARALISESALLKKVRRDFQEEFFKSSEDYARYHRWVGNKLSELEVKLTSGTQAARQFADLRMFIVSGLSYRASDREGAVALAGARLNTRPAALDCPVRIARATVRSFIRGLL